MEPIELTISLVNLFSSMLSILDRISAAKSYGSDYHLVITKLEIEGLGSSYGVKRWGLWTLGEHQIKYYLIRRFNTESGSCWLGLFAFFEDAEGLAVGKRHRGVAYVSPRLGYC